MCVVVVEKSPLQSEKPCAYNGLGRIGPDKNDLPIRIRHAECKNFRFKRADSPRWKVHDSEDQLSSKIFY
jgi:hypothetical protein